ncbi:hypothetical protein IIB79_05860 [candidate division KSB1 bacterium]|nr:hypothetical protein [candidate division KSB1 bacterium]
MVYTKLSCHFDPAMREEISAFSLRLIRVQRKKCLPECSGLDGTTTLQF